MVMVVLFNLVILSTCAVIPHVVAAIHLFKK
jgi:hypothetical protein